MKTKRVLYLTGITFFVIGIFCAGMQTAWASNGTVKVQKNPPQSDQYPIEEEGEALSPFGDMEEFSRQMQHIFRQNLRKGYNSAFSNIARYGRYDPDFDVLKTEKHYVLKADMPGINKEEITIELKERKLTISGAREEKIEKTDENEYYYRERRFGSFSRTFSLPDDAKGEGIEAAFDNGVLTITIPHHRESSKTKGIVIPVQ